MRKKVLLITTLILVLTVAVTGVTWAAWTNVNGDTDVEVKSGEWDSNADNLRYEEIKNKDMLTVGYRLVGFVDGPKGSIVKIPSTYMDLPITNIAASFSSEANSDIVKIVISSSVLVIEQNAFSDMLLLRDVVFSGDGITTIEKEAFQRNENIIKITIPATITTIGEDVLASCPNLSIIDIKTRSANVNNGTPPVGLGIKADGTKPTIKFVK